MIKEQLYHKTVDILVQAYFNDTLKHSDCCACAVGNIIAANLGYNIKNNEDSRYPMVWVDGGGCKLPYPGSGKDSFGWGAAIVEGVNENHNYGEAKKQIDASGYSIYELAYIEKAFESANKEFFFGDDPPSDEIMFKGLMEVINILDQIHENKDEVVTNSSKQKFTKRELSISK